MAEAVVDAPAKRGVIAFKGTVAELRSLTWFWVLVDTKTTVGSIWDYEPKRRIWRRTTNRGGR